MHHKRLLDNVVNGAASKSVGRYDRGVAGGGWTAFILHPHMTYCGYFLVNRV